MTSLMAREAAEAPAAVARQAASPGFAALAARLRARPPRFAVTCARGSSDHASGYGKYLIEHVLGLPVASVGPSIASVYGRRLALADSVFFAVSQSGGSPDLRHLTQAAREAGALVVGLINARDSPLAAVCDLVLDLHAGPEHSVAATKSCLAAMAAFLHIVAAWSGEAHLAAQVAALPAALTAAAGCDWLPALAGIAEPPGIGAPSLNAASLGAPSLNAPSLGAPSLYVIGRGPGLAAAQEMALKCKEVARLHAEAFSAAEVAHGPMALVGPGFPVIALAQDDASQAHTREVAARMAALGAGVRLAGAPLPGVADLPMPPGLPAESAPLAALQAFYPAIERIARARGLDPDRPPHLRKVTQTL
jgi:glucosamine--fructose-6-phosphate aminotransferase (isomerizing)